MCMAGVCPRLNFFWIAQAVCFFCEFFLGKMHYSAPVKKNVLMSAFLDTVFKGDWNITGGDIFVYDNFIKSIRWKLYAFWKLLIADNH